MNYCILVLWHSGIPVGQADTSVSFIGCYTNAGMQECKCGNAGMPECRNAGMQECPNAGMPECRNAGMPECRNARMHQCRNVGVPGCRNAGVPECAGSIFQNVLTSFLYRNSMVQEPHYPLHLSLPSSPAHIQVFHTHTPTCTHTIACLILSALKDPRCLTRVPKQ